MQISGEIKALGDAIVRMHDGQMWFNLTQARKIVGQGKNSLARKLHDEGITVKRKGPSKMLTAYDIAEYMLKNRIAPIDNDSQRKKPKGA